MVGSDFFIEFSTYERPHQIGLKGGDFLPASFCHMSA